MARFIIAQRSNGQSALFLCPSGGAPDDYPVIYTRIVGSWWPDLGGELLQNPSFYGRLLSADEVPTWLTEHPDFILFKLDLEHQLLHLRTRLFELLNEPTGEKFIPLSTSKP